MGNFARTVASVLGYDLVRKSKALRSSFSFEANLFRLLSNHDFDCVIDVGANVGNFSQLCLKKINNSPVYSFEPAKDIADGLALKAKGNPRWFIVPSALGDENGQALLHISSHESVFNSLNSANPDFLSVFQGLESNRDQMVSVLTLDTFCRDNDLGSYRDILLKIDTQGHDFKVLRGATETLKQARAVIVELPFQNIYDSRESYRDILDFMAEAGFKVYGLSTISCDPKGSIIEAGAFFVRP